MTLTDEDISDMRTVLNEQFNILQKLKPLIHGTVPSDFHFMFEDIIDCNKVMMEIVYEPTGGIERLV